MVGASVTGSERGAGGDGSPLGLSIVLVHYNTPDLLRTCLACLASVPSALRLQILVVDNASSGAAVRQMAAAFPAVRFLYNRTNVGFARASNQGIRVTDAPYCLLLNPDAVIGGGAIQHLLQVMASHPAAGAVAPRLISPDGSLQLSCRRFPTLRVLVLRAARLDRLFPRAVDRYLMRDWDHAQERVVDWAMGACLLLRRQALEAVGLLDEGFFMYYEDLDLCYRMRVRGWETRYVPAATAEHAHQRGSAAWWPNRLTWVHLHSLVRLWRKRELSW